MYVNFSNLGEKKWRCIMLNQDTIEKALAHKDGRIRCAAVGNCKGNAMLTVDFVDKLRKSYFPHERQAAMLACVDAPFRPLGWIVDGLNDTDYSVKEAAILALKCRKDVGVRTIERWLASDVWYWRRAGINACVSKNVSIRYLNKWLKKYSLDSELEHYVAAVAAGCVDNYDIPDELAEAVFWETKSAYAKDIAAEAIAGRCWPSGKIVAMLHHPDTHVRRAGLYACMRNHSVPYVEIGDMLVSDDQHVRCLASYVCDKSRPTLARVINPREHVYKKCVGDVIVAASIPEDAQVRGNERYGYRADKATIVDVDGKFCGESVGVSLYKHDVTYCVGKEVFVKDFDFSYETMTTGFHFFTDYDQAKAY